MGSKWHHQNLLPCLSRTQAGILCTILPYWPCYLTPTLLPPSGNAPSNFCISLRSPVTHGHAQIHQSRIPGYLSKWLAPAICLRDHAHRKKGDRLGVESVLTIRIRNNYSLGPGLKTYHFSDTLQPSCQTEALFITRNLAVFKPVTSR